MPNETPEPTPTPLIQHPDAPAEGGPSRILRPPFGGKDPRMIPPNELLKMLAQAPGAPDADRAKQMAEAMQSMMQMSPEQRNELREYSIQKLASGFARIASVFSDSDAMTLEACLHLACVLAAKANTPREAFNDLLDTRWNAGQEIKLRVDAHKQKLVDEEQQKKNAESAAPAEAPPPTQE